MKLGDIIPGISLAGIEPAHVVAVVTTVPFGEDTVQLIYRTPDGMIEERLLNRTDEASVEVATLERPSLRNGLRVVCARKS